MALPLIYLCAALLAVGAAPLPYGYYTFLRFVACGVFAFAAFVAYSRNSQVLPYLYGALAVLFNPLVKIHMPKEVWAAVDLASAVFLAVTAKRVKGDA